MSQQIDASALPPAWILAGGLGTRLKSVLADRPKALAPVAGRPFLDILFDQLLCLGFTECVLLLGVRHEAILEFLAQRQVQRKGLPDLRVLTSIERSPLGTGGAIQHARSHATGPFFVLNGDTFVDFDARSMLQRHKQCSALLTIAVVQQPDTRRYGSVEVAPDGTVCGFREKAAGSGPGFINAGVYLMQPELLDYISNAGAVSLEQTVLPSLVRAGKRICAVEQFGEFFDIGTPDSLLAFESRCTEVEPRRLEETS